MMRAVVAKLRRTCGETLVETLAAVLVCTLAATLLMSSVSAAGYLNRNARTVTKQEQVQADNAARYAGYWHDGDNGEAASGTVTVSDKGDAALSESFSGDEVKVYGGDLIVSYEVEVDGA